MIINELQELIESHGLDEAQDALDFILDKISKGGCDLDGSDDLELETLEEFVSDHRELDTKHPGVLCGAPHQVTGVHRLTCTSLMEQLVSLMTIQ
jgi:hypothetical protein